MKWNSNSSWKNFLWYPEISWCYTLVSVHFSSVTPVVSDSLWPHELQHAGLPVHHQLLEFTQTHVPLSRWCQQTISTSVVPFPPALNLSHQGLSESALCIRWPKYWSLSFNISPSNEYPGLIPLARTSCISLQSKGLSRVFSNTTVQKHQFFGTQLSHSPTLTYIHDHRKNHSLA